MCWSFTASIIFTTLGLVLSAYLIWKKDDKFLWTPLIYFTLMEFLQVLTYIYIDQCNLPINQMLTYLGYLHIAFQPFFINMVGMHFIPTHIRDRVQGYVYALCFVSAILIIVKAYPFAWAQSCVPGVDTMCGISMCSARVSWHLGWFIPIKNYGFIVEYAYLFTGFILPMVYGSWKLNVYHFLVGPLLAKAVSGGPNEYPAVWCLFSIAFVSAIFIKWIRKSMYVKTWYGLKYPWKK